MNCINWNIWECKLYFVERFYSPFESSCLSMSGTWWSRIETGQSRQDRKPAWPTDRPCIEQRHIKEATSLTNYPIPHINCCSTPPQATNKPTTNCTESFRKPSRTNRPKPRKNQITITLTLSIQWEHPWPRQRPNNESRGSHYKLQN